MELKYNQIIELHDRKTDSKRRGRVVAASKYYVAIDFGNGEPHRFFDASEIDYLG